MTITDKLARQSPLLGARWTDSNTAPPHRTSGSLLQLARGNSLTHSTPLGRETMHRLVLPVLSAVLLMLGCSIGYSQVPETRAPLALQHVVSVLPSAIPVGRTPAAEPMTLTLVLPLRDRPELDALLRRVCDPQDPLYGHYLAPNDFAHRFGPAPSDVEAVVGFARAHGLNVSSVSASGTLVHVTAPAALAETAFGVRLYAYAGTDGRPFFAPDREPTVSSEVASRLLGVLGLSDAQKGRPLARLAGASSQLKAYTGHVGLAPPDIKNIYGLAGTPFTGAGQIAALYEDTSFKQSNVNDYLSTYAISIPVNPVSVDGFPTGSYPDGDASEVTLDIDMLAALAPHLAQIRVYEADTAGVSFAQSLVDTFTAMAEEPASSRPNVISVSYAAPEDAIAPADFAALDQATAQLAAQGQTVCVAAGDAGAYADQGAGAAPNVDFPADDPYVLCVGGTDLNDRYDANRACVYVSETSWGAPWDHGRGPIGTGGGGGHSAYFPFPWWQAGAFTASGNPQASFSNRNMPDVSLFGDYDDGGYDVFYTDPASRQSNWICLNGTSAAAPLWAAFLADVNQARAAERLPTIGFSNPAIYGAAESHPGTFLDTFDGSNNLFYRAVHGYDNATGWGSFSGANLLSVLAAPPVPVIGGFAPTDGLIGTQVALTGSGFSSTTNMSIGGSPAAFKILSDTHILATVPPQAVTGPIVLLGPGGRSTTGVNFVVNPAPVITQFAPTNGAPGTKVALYGYGFLGATNMSIGGVATSFVVNSDSNVTATVPLQAVTGPIVLLGPGGRSTTGVNFVVLH